MENETLRVIRNRTSLRVYDTSPLSEEEENTIIESAMLAPTAGNQMLYSMIIIRDQEKKKQLSKLCDYQLFIQSAPLVIVFVADHHRWFDYFRMNNVKDFAEKNGLDFTSPAQGDLMLAIEDAMAAAQNSVIAAESMGIGSCYIGDILENYETVKELLQLPDETFPIAMLCYGHYKDHHKKVFRKRFDKKYVVFEDSYRQLQKDDYEQMFTERAEKEFLKQSSRRTEPFQGTDVVQRAESIQKIKSSQRTEFKYEPENFAQQFYARKTGAAFSKEMTRSVKEALKEWTGE